jgi:hypothetical protein
MFFLRPSFWHGFSLRAIFCHCPKEDFVAAGIV